MNIHKFLSILALLMLPLGCSPAPDSPRPDTKTPNVMPRLNPSPTPSDSSLPHNCQITDLKIHINEMDGYCFAYPIRFTAGNQPSDKPDIQGPAVDDSTEPIHGQNSA
jgi:hypothetical protein